jgi:hypothetical protein
MPDHYTSAKNIAIVLLRTKETRTENCIREAALKSINMIKDSLESIEIDADALISDLMHLFSVGVEEATVLEDHDLTRHIPWLTNRRVDIRWRFWNRYVTYLEQDFGMPPSVVANLDNMTDMILERLENPDREGSWDRRGMVVGSVQSGKTANYIGLINKAVDAGYKLIIVLAGIHNNLRAQTQIRVDEGVLGFDTQMNRCLNTDNRWIGVGNIPSNETLVIHSLTSSIEQGDFKRSVADNIGVMIGGDPVILVMKKNSHLLKNLIKWVLHVRGETKPNGRRIIKNVPLLLIDDEADNASINTRNSDNTNTDSVSAINGKIRNLLDSFEKSAYIGYTATPFANIFINPDAEGDTYGRDLFPESFIINVKAPTNYVGPAKVFGLDGDIDAGIEGRDGLPIVYEIDDFSSPSGFPPQHKKDHVPTVLPDTLKHAIKCFILTCSARLARGHNNKHNSMLIHVSRFVAVQNNVKDLVETYLYALKRRIEFGDGNRTPPLLDELKNIWNDEYISTSQCLGADAGTEINWETVCSKLHAAASKIHVMAVNGSAKEALDYFEQKEQGLSVIAVGGNKLSRGLTLEGLSISYFLRTSRMYDTLMQMGRWFGYRPDYLDLCRLYSTRQLIAWYRHIALVDVELRREFDYMVNAGLTPKDYGLRVRTHPGGMIISALNKMCHSRRLELSWAGVLVQTTQLPKDIDRISNNQATTEELLGKLGNQTLTQVGGSWIWTGCSAEDVCEFLEKLQYPPESSRASGSQLATFIRKQIRKSAPELNRWTVVLISSTIAEKRHVIADYEVGLVDRTPDNPHSDSYILKKSNILNPEDESIDLDLIPVSDIGCIENKSDIFDEACNLIQDNMSTFKDIAVAITQQRIREGKIKRGREDTRRPNGRVVRELRPKSNGLLLIYPLLAKEYVPATNGRPEESTGLCENNSPLIGVAISFPTSNSVLGVEYQVGRIWDAVLQEDSSYED